MRTKHQIIIAELHEQVELLIHQFKEPALHAAAAILLIEKVIIEVNELFSAHEFPSQEDEIHFFKFSKPESGNKKIKKYLQEQMLILECFYEENKEFYKYHKSGNTCHDHIYYVRGKHDIRNYINSISFVVDEKFCTYHCYLKSKILANKLFGIYLENSLLAHKKNPIQSINTKVEEVKLIWTGSQISFIELVYALHEDKAINNGNLTLAQFMESMGSKFNVNPGHFNGSIYEMKSRNSQAKYMNSLATQLVKRMNRDDE